MVSSNNPLRKSTGPTGTFWTPARVMLTVTVLTLLASLGLSSCNSTEQSTPSNSGVASSKGPSGVGSPAIRAPVANNVPPAAFIALPQGVRDAKLQTLDGQSLKLSDFDNKVLVLNIWATWCGPCRKEMPELVKMSNEYKSRGLVVLGLATSYNEQNDEQHVKDYVRTQNVPYKIIWDDGTLAGPLVEAVQGRQVIPQSFVISRDGKIVKHFQGFSELSTPQLMRQAIEDALNDKGKA